MNWKMARTVGAWHEDEDAGKMPAFLRLRPEGF